MIDTNRSQLHRDCWEPVLVKNPSGPKTVRLATEITVSPEGKVQTVGIVGGDAYPGLTKCLEGQLRRWTFPRAQSTSSLMFPFVFEKKDETTVSSTAPKGNSSKPQKPGKY
jgi:hypothetical protein